MSILLKYFSYFSSTFDYFLRLKFQYSHPFVLRHPITCYSPDEKDQFPYLTREALP
jgi:hypothetical protein